MKIRELILELSTYDPEWLVFMQSNHDMNDKKIFNEVWEVYPSSCIQLDIPNMVCLEPHPGAI